LKKGGREGFLARPFQSAKVLLKIKLFVLLRLVIVALIGIMHDKLLCNLDILHRYAGQVCDGNLTLGGSLKLFV